MSRTADWLARLVRHETVSNLSNLALIEEVDGFLTGLGYRTQRLPDATEPKAGLYAEIGPPGPHGILLSAHSDVVPVAGQTWTRDPFTLSEDGERLYGRGTTDMKGYLAAMLAAAERAAARKLTAPFQLLISYDEEIGCVGLARMLPALPPLLGAPRLAVVGEPTEMRVAVGHKGKRAYRAKVQGQAGHSALAPRFANAINLAARFIGQLEEMQRDIAQNGTQDAAYDIPYTTLHVGMLNAGQALNIVPDHAEMRFEMRFLAEDDPDQIETRIKALADACATAFGVPAGIKMTREIAYPGLTTDDAALIGQLRRAAGTDTCKVAFGTEAGFLSGLGIPTLVCGPGAMQAQGHKPDEFITRAQLARCDKMLDALIEDISC
ncbi:MAG: acetylornithine deacetylase [Pseudomonadota bacterium]